MTPAVIVAFDGVLADTLPLRCHALRDACVAEGVLCDEAEINETLPGRTFAEAGACLTPARADPTLADLIGLRAQRAYGALVAHGVPLQATLVQQLRHHAARGARVVVRADSERRQVEPLLALAGLEPLVSLLRCADDLPRGADPSLVRSWTVIDARLTRLGVALGVRTACEATATTAVVAAPYVAAVVVGADATPVMPGEFGSGTG